VNADHEDENERPWEEPGAVRRDCEPHRGRTLLALAQFPLLLYVVWHILSCGRVSFRPGLPVGAAGIAVIDLAVNLAGVGFAAWLYAATRRDLARIAAGEMDPSGRRQTLMAQMGAWLGISVGLSQILGCVIVPYWQSHHSP
jgi:hypothetical protein